MDALYSRELHLLATHLDDGELILGESPSPTWGWLFLAPTITRLIPDYTGADKYLTIDGGIPKAEDYDPAKHVNRTPYKLLY
jgi:hypothetical protein